MHESLGNRVPQLEIRLTVRRSSAQIIAHNRCSSVNALHLGCSGVRKVGNALGESVELSLG